MDRSAETYLQTKKTHRGTHDHRHHHHGYGHSHLVLTHLIPSPTTDAQRQSYADDLSIGGYTGQVTVARDLTKVTI